MFRILYCSQSRLPDEPAAQKAALENILAVSRRNNMRNDITGALVFTRGSFAQVLEGAQDDVEMTLARIAADPRHDAIRTLEVGPVPRREFPDWAMAFAGRERADNPLLVQTLAQAMAGLPSAGADILAYLRLAL